MDGHFYIFNWESAVIVFYFEGRCLILKSQTVGRSEGNLAHNVIMVFVHGFD